MVEAAEGVQLKGSFSLLRAPEIRQAPVGNLKLGSLKTTLNPNLGMEMWGIPIKKVPHMFFFGWEKNGCMWHGCMISNTLETGQRCTNGWTS